MVQDVSSEHAMRRPVQTPECEPKRRRKFCFGLAFFGVR
jgi:hypothetical protein